MRHERQVELLQRVADAGDHLRGLHAPHSAVRPASAYTDPAVHMALWALLVAGTAFLLLHIPQMRDARAKAEAQRALEISQENKLYCEKWGMRAGTHEHITCTMDLDAIQAKVEQRIVEDNFF